MSSFFKRIKRLVATASPEKALKELFDVADYFNDEIEDEIILLQARLTQLNNDKGKNIAAKDNNEKPSINKAILDLVKKIKEEFPDFEVPKYASQTKENTTSISINTKGVFIDEIQEGLAILNQKKLGYASTEEDIKKTLDLKKKLYDEIFGELDDSINNIEQIRSFESSIYFDEIFGSPVLHKLTIQTLFSIRTDKKKYKWYDRSLIVSGLTLSLISHKFDSKKVVLLIDFLTEFEEEVWQRALVGLVLVLMYHQNRIKRYNHLTKRLESLQDLPKIQKGIQTIDLILLDELYKMTLFNPESYKDVFFLENPRNCFLPFYKDNPNLEDALENTPNKELDLDEIADFITELPLLNAHKYFLTEGLKQDKLEKVELKENEKKAFNNTLRLSYYLHPFQNLITEFYLFYSFYPKNNIKNLFTKEMGLANSNLKDIILGEKEKLFINARAASKNKKYAQAIKYCNQLLEINPNDIEILDILADSFYGEKIYHKAIIHLKKLIKIGKGDLSEYYNKLGACYGKNDDDQKAISYFKKAIEIESNNAKYLFNLSIVLNKLKRYDEAVIYLKKAVEIEPDNANYLSDLGITFINLEQYEEAKKYLQKAVEIEPNNVDFLNNLGVTLSLLKQYEEAKKHLQKAVKIAPKDVSSLNNLGATLINLKQYEEAKKHLQKAVKIDPKDVSSLSNLGRSYLFLKQSIKAEKILLQALKIEKNNAIYRSLGHIELYNKNTNKATEYYKKCMDTSESIEEFEEMFDDDIIHIEGLGIDIALYHQIKEEVIAYKKAKAEH